MGSVSVCWNTVDHAVSWNIYDFYWALKKGKRRPVCHKERDFARVRENHDKLKCREFLKEYHTFRKSNYTLKYTSDFNHSSYWLPLRYRRGIKPHIYILTVPSVTLGILLWHSLSCFKSWNIMSVRLFSFKLKTYSRLWQQNPLTK